MIRSSIALPRAIALAFTLVLLLLAAPADACGCGAYIPREGEAHVGQERALIRWDGRTEDIVMELGVEGSSQEAAWILPVPAQATVKQGDPRLFETLQELTKPRVRVEHVSGPIPASVGGGAPPVTLLERQTLGPFDVSTLAATDADALGAWLTTNGYQFPAGLAEVLRPYIEQQWFYVAVRLAPEASSKPLTGRLDPLWVTFESDTIVYPMRPTALARNELSVFLYVLADHRVEPPLSFRPRDDEWRERQLWVKFADWIEPASLDSDSPLAPFVPHKVFLTKFELRIGAPATIKDDFVFPFAAADNVHHEFETHYVEVPPSPSLPFLLLGIALLGLPLLVVIMGMAWFIWRRWRPRAG